MSKSSHTTAFRKVDVDQLDEDRFQDDAGDVPGGEQGVSENEVQGLLNKKESKEALLLLLNKAPVGAESDQVKMQAFSLVLRVLMQVKANDIDNCVKSLDNRNLDTLMKYIYRGFSEPSDNSCATLLTWHQKVFDLGGLGSIMRVMTDRKRV